MVILQSIDWRRRGSNCAAGLLAGLVLAGSLALTKAQAQNYVTPYAFTTMAGSVQNPGSADGTNSNAEFYWPYGVAVDPSDNVYVVDNVENTVRKVAPSGTNWVVTTIAGTAGNSGANDGSNGAVAFNEPTALARDGAGNLYVADGNNNSLRELVMSGTNWVSSTIAGTSGPGNYGSRDGTNGVAQFEYPSGVAVDAAANLYVADTYNNTIRRVVHLGTNWVVTTIAGSAAGGGFADGTNQMAQFSQPAGIAVDAATNIFVADTGNSCIRKITPVGTNWVVTTIAGTYGRAGYADGTNGAAEFYSPLFIGPMGLAVDANDNVYVADGGNGVIREVSPLGTNWVTTSLAGLQTAPPANVDGAGTNALFGTPAGIAVDHAGRLFVGDIGNSDMREGVLAILPALTISLDASNNVVLSWPGGLGTLQTNADLTTPNWGNYGGAVNYSNGSNNVSLQPLGGNLFFRLAE